MYVSFGKVLFACCFFVIMLLTGTKSYAEEGAPKGTMQLDEGFFFLEIDDGGVPLKLSGEIDAKNGTDLIPETGSDIRFLVHDNRDTKENYHINQTLSILEKEGNDEVIDKEKVESITIQNTSEIGGGILKRNDLTALEETTTIYEVNPESGFTVIEWLTTFHGMKTKSVYIETGTYKGTLTTELVVAPNI